MRGTFVPRTEGFEPVSRLGVREGGCLADTRLVSFQSTVRHALVKRVAEQGLVGACLPQTASVHDCPAWNCLRLAEQSRERGVARTQLMRDPPEVGSWVIHTVPSDAVVVIAIVLFIILL